MKHLHLIAAKYHGQTETRGPRISFTSYRFNDRATIAQKYSEEELLQQAADALTAKGYTIESHGNAPGLIAIFAVSEFKPLNPKNAAD